MKITSLWSKLTPIVNTETNLKKDLSEGKVPELPYFIVDQEEVKTAISKKLNDIDGDRMQTNLIIAPYGNGKTNLIKYIKLYFQTNNYNIDVIYSRADIDQPDLILLLLKLIQDHYTNVLMDSIIQIRNDNQYSDLSFLANSYEDNFSSIREYCEAVLSQKYADESLKKLIYLGTGRLYSKGNFNQYQLEQFNNFNRREILVFFLNILSKTGKYIIFGIDEVEKIREKSNLRFNQFLTSYRELIDLFNKIYGHYLLTCFTDAQGRYNIQAANEALFTRIEPDIKDLEVINKKEDVTVLTKYLDELFKINLKEEGIERVVSQVLKKRARNNRELLRHTIEFLNQVNESYSFEDLLEKANLTKIYDDSRNEIESEGLFKSINQKFFDPLEYYLEDLYLIENNDQIDRRDNQSFNDIVNKKIHYFIFNERNDLNVINRKANDLYNKFQNKLIIYSPIKAELSNSSIHLNNDNYEFSIVDYEPDKLFVLLVMYENNFELRSKINEVISSYTDFNL